MDRDEREWCRSSQRAYNFLHNAIIDTKTPNDVANVLGELQVHLREVRDNVGCSPLKMPHGKVAIR